MSKSADHQARWNEAADAYRQAREVTSDVISARLWASITRAGAELQQFLDSPEGEAAKRLLAESRSYVILGTRDIDDLIAIVGLTSRGLARANGCGLHLIDNPTAPLPERIVLIAAEEAVQFCAIADKNPRDPVTFMSYIKERLDSISKDAPKAIALR